MKFIDKVKWILGISVVFFLIAATNLVDRQNFNRVRDAVITIYEDRLVAKDIVFNMAVLIKEKELAIASSENMFFATSNSTINDQLEILVNQFVGTKLTTEEKRVFNSLQTNLEELKTYEQQMMDSAFEDTQKVSKQLVAVNKNLKQLSDIQLEEGRRQLFVSNRAMDTIDLFTQMEIYFLIALAVLIQIIVIYKPKFGGD